MKLYGLGVRGYCADYYNVFDGVVVILSFVELIIELTTVSNASSESISTNPNTYKYTTFEENIEEAVSPETVQSPLQMSSVINSELKGSKLPTENCARGLGVNKKFGN